MILHSPITPRLESGASADDGSADLRFSLWSWATDPASGGQIAATIARNAVPVTIGLFTTSFYFGFGLIDNK